MAVKKNKISQEEINTNKVMYTIMLSFLGAAILFYMYRAFQTGKGISNYAEGGWIYSVSIGAVFFVATLIWFILWKLDKVKSKGVSWTPLNWFCTAVFAFAAFGYIKIRQLMNKKFDPADAIKFLFVALLIFVILYIIFYFSKRAFFTYSVLSTFFGTIMYLFSFLDKKWYVSLYIISAVIAVLSVLFIIVCKNNGGAISFNIKKIIFFGSKSKYYFHFALCVFFIAFIIAFLIYGKNIAIYSFYAIIAFEVITSIYSNYKNI